MAANQTFQITISAVDKATATIRKINDSMSKITRPFEEVGKSFKSLGREIGIDKIGKNLSKMGYDARDAARGIGNIVAPLAGISGIATVAGVINLADSVANLSRNLTYSARGIGISTTSLQQWQGAAREAGLSSESATAALAGLGKTMEDAASGRNQLAYMQLGRMHISLKPGANGKWDTSGAMMQIADYISKMKNPQAQRKVADVLGVSAIFPMLQQGTMAILRYKAAAQKAGIVLTPVQIASAEEFAQSLSKMDVSALALKYSIGNALIPAIKPLTDELSDWIGKNKDLISTDIGDWVRDVAHWIKSVDWTEIGHETTDFIEDIGKVVHALGGVKGILIEIGAIKVLSFAGSAAMGLLNIMALTKAMKGLRGAAKAASAAEAVAAAGGAGGAAAGAAGAAEGGAGAVAAGILTKVSAWAFPVWALFHSEPLGGKRRADGTYEDEFDWNSAAGRAAIAKQKAQRAKTAQHPAHASTHGDVATRGIRNNNPGNIIYGKFARRMGATGEDTKGFAIFPTAAQGINAIGENLRSYGHKGFDTPFEIAHRWSTTDQAAYTKNLAALFGGNPNKQLDMTDPKVISALSNGIITQENGSNPYVAQAGPYTAGGGKTKDGKQHFDITLHGLPPGTTAEVKASGENTASARVAYRSVGRMS